MLATNTSALSVAAMGEGLEHPERLVGMHFFNPVALMPLVELVRTPDTDDAALATAWAVARRPNDWRNGMPPGSEIVRSNLCVSQAVSEK